MTYEIRVRVPPEARGGKFKGTHTSRTLGTRDKAEALRHRLKVYGDLQAEFEAAATGRLRFSARNCNSQSRAANLNGKQVSGGLNSWAFPTCSRRAPDIPRGVSGAEFAGFAGGLVAAPDTPDKIKKKERNRRPTAL